jgi:hypothetical protein
VQYLEEDYHYAWHSAEVGECRLHTERWRPYRLEAVLETWEVFLAWAATIGVLFCWYISTVGEVLIVQRGSHSVIYVP